MAGPIVRPWPTTKVRSSDHFIMEAPDKRSPLPSTKRRTILHPCLTRDSNPVLLVKQSAPLPITQAGCHTLIRSVKVLMVQHQFWCWTSGVSKLTKVFVYIEKFDFKMEPVFLPPGTAKNLQPLHVQFFQDYKYVIKKIVKYSKTLQHLRLY